MTNQSFFERLDAMVRWTGIPALAEGKPKRRPLRWPATFALIFAVAGYMLVLAVRGPTFLGWLGLIAGVSLGNVMRVWGPLKPFGAMEPTDEWDRATRARSIAFTYMTVSVTVPAGLCLLVAFAPLAGWDMAQLSRAVLASGFLMMTIFSALPTAHASWTVRWEDEI